MTAPSDVADELSQLRRMRLASIAEGCTLLVLVFIAVPLKHLGGHPLATAIMGPVHGLAFLLYVWTLIQTVSARTSPGRTWSAWWRPPSFRSAASSTHAPCADASPSSRPLERGRRACRSISGSRPSTSPRR